MKTRRIANEIIFIYSTVQDDDITVMATKIDELMATTTELKAQLEAAKQLQEKRAPVR